MALQRRGRIVALSFAGIVMLLGGLFVANRIAEAAAREKRLAAIDDLAELLVEAHRANTAHDIELEADVLGLGVGLEGTAEDRAEVERRLAVLDWKYRHEFEKAESRLKAATKGADSVEAWLALSRMEYARERFDAAAGAAREAIAAADSTTGRWKARLALADAVVEGAGADRLAGGSVNDGSLRSLFDELLAMVEEEPGHLVASRRLLQAALLLDRGGDALAAWRSYYRVAPGSPMPDAIAEGGARLAEILPAWGDEPPTPEDRVALVRALAATRFFTEAAIVAKDPAHARELEADTRVRDIVLYADLARRMEEITNEYYRITSLGEGSRGDYLEELRGEARRFLTAVGREIDEDAPIESLREVLSSEYGAMVNLGKTAGYYDLHMGHIVVDTRRHVDQYGHTADVRFVMLDQIVSNGFQSWAWESGAQHGGWGGSELIVQIRPVYMNGPLNAWREMNDPEEKRRFLEELEQETVTDDERATSNPYAYLPGLAMRLEYQGGTRLLERLTEQDLDDDAVRLAFLKELERVVQESSIFAHEGRHAVDAAGAATGIPTWKKEYNAKLSEVVFAPEPRLALSGIFSSTIGDDSPHGRANAKIMKELVGWMRKHGAEIEGLDPDRPLLPQFDRLSDEQIRDAFRSLDAMAS